jgi:transcriptional regulator with XRE-family HTH domain
MPTNPLSSALKTKQKEGKLSIAALAEAIGVNVQGVTAVLKAKSVPNATTAPKYAKFLGLSAEEFQAMTKPAAKAGKAKAGKTAKVSRGKKAKKSKKAAPAKAAAKPAKDAKSKGVSLAEAAELAADALAVETHRASEAQRTIIATVLSTKL